MHAIIHHRSPLTDLADSKRSSPSLLARQLRLRLVADDDSDIPRNLHNIVVSIHAIATFQALHDYLRPRVSGLLSGGSRLSGMLAALAASGFGPGGSSSRAAAAEELRQSISAARSPAPPAAESSAAAGSSSISTITRRRSQRLSAKKSGTNLGETDPDPAAPEVESTEAVIPDAPTSDVPMAASSTDAAPSDTIVHDSGFTADFDDDEIDAEVFHHTSQLRH